MCKMIDETMPLVSYELLRALEALNDKSVSRIVILGDPTRVFVKPIPVTIHKTQGKTIHELLGYKPYHNMKEMG